MTKIIVSIDQERVCSCSQVNNLLLQYLVHYLLHIDQYIFLNLVRISIGIIVILFNRQLLMMIKFAIFMRLTHLNNNNLMDLDNYSFCVGILIQFGFYVILQMCGFYVCLSSYVLRVTIFCIHRKQFTVYYLFRYFMFVLSMLRLSLLQVVVLQNRGALSLGEITTLQNLCKYENQGGNQSFLNSSIIFLSNCFFCSIFVCQIYA